MKHHLSSTAVIRKNQPTNFAQKARISNSMRKDANNKAYEFLKRTDPLVYMNDQPSTLNGFDHVDEYDFLDNSRNSLSPNHKMYKAKLTKKSSENRKVKSTKKDINNENQEDQNIEKMSLDRPKPKYSLYKRNDE